MTGFAPLEQSNDAGQPISLYLFRWGNSQWGYTSADRELLVDSVTYAPIPISDDGLQQGPIGQKEFTVHMPTALPGSDGAPVDIPVVALFRSTPPSEPVFLTVRKKQFADAEAVIHWIGKVGNVVRTEGGSQADITCRNPGLKRTGLRLTWARICPHFLFDSGCALAKADFAITRNVTAVTGNSFTLDGADLAATPYYNGGFIEWDADGLGTLERRGIEATLGVNQYQLFGRADGITVGMAVTIYPGCDGSAQTCDEKFNNLVNYGGVDFMPGKSPFDGHQVF
jgi:uncharacterized phage protein (TIGR02218 family)